MNILSIVGKSGSGKTTLIEKLITALKSHSIKVGIIKHHAHKGFEIDKPGKDTWRYAQAGANSVAMISPNKMFVVQETQIEMTLNEIKSMVGNVDIIITDGYKKENTLKIELIRSAVHKDIITPIEDLAAIISDLDFKLNIPCYSLNDIAGLANFIIDKFISEKK